MSEIDGIRDEPRTIVLQRDGTELSVTFRGFKRQKRRNIRVTEFSALSKKIGAFLFANLPERHGRYRNKLTMSADDLAACGVTSEHFQEEMKQVFLELSSFHLEIENSERKTTTLCSLVSSIDLDLDERTVVVNFPRALSPIFGELLGNALLGESEQLKLHKPETLTKDVFLCQPELDFGV